MKTLEERKQAMDKAQNKLDKTRAEFYKSISKIARAKYEYDRTYRESAQTQDKPDKEGE